MNPEKRVINEIEIEREDYSSLQDIDFIFKLNY